MNRKIKLIISFFLFCGTLYAAIEKSEDWKKIRDDGTIISYEKSDGSEILTIRGVALVKAPLAVVGQLLRDVSLSTKWVGFCTEARVLEQIDKNHVIFYEQFQLPWPVSPRDLVAEANAIYWLRVLRGRANGRVVSYKGMPEVDGYVRVPDMNFSIEVEYIDSQTTGLIYTLDFNPGGLIPPFLANLTNREFFYNNMKMIEKILSPEDHSGVKADQSDVRDIAGILQSPRALREVMRERLEKYVKSKKNLDVLVASDEVFRRWQQNESAFANLLFLGRFEEDYRKEVITLLLESYFQEAGLDEALYGEYLSDSSWRRELAEGDLSGRAGLMRAPVSGDSPSGDR